MTAFGDAFKAARSAGKSVFKFQGKSYHTKTADEMGKAKKKVATPTARPDRPSPAQSAVDSAPKSAPKAAATAPKQDYPRPATDVGIAKAKSPIGQAAARLANAPAKAPIPSAATAAKTMGNAGAPLSAAQKASISQANAKPAAPAAAAPQKQGPQPEDQQWFAKKGSAISLGIARRKNAPSR